MLHKIINAGLSTLPYLRQTALESNWRGRSVTTLCKNCTPRCFHFEEALKTNALCKFYPKTTQDKRVVTHSAIASDGNDDPKFGDALNSVNTLNPLYPFQKGLLKTNSALHWNHPLNWDDSSSKTSHSSNSSSYSDSSNDSSSSGSSND